MARERQIKGWSRAKKLALIRGDTAALHRLSARHTRGKSPRPVSEIPLMGYPLDST
jgi:predicted GIY-YIG superfamily endonuclease